MARKNDSVDSTQIKKGGSTLPEALNEAILEALPIGVCLTDEEGNYRFMNSAYCSIYEYVREEMIGQHYSVIMPSDQVKLANEHYARLLEGDTGIPSERKRQRKDGSIVYIEAANALVKLADGKKMVITAVRDITDRKQMQAELEEANAAYKALHATLREQATRDSLTGLYNRRYFNETIDRELSRAKRDNYPVSVLIMDIDFFKDLNDSHGHEFGDEALRLLSSMIIDNIRAGDIAYRYGGDEFVIVLPGADIEIARNRAELISQSFSKAIKLATISAGIALYPEHAENGHELIRYADQALYRAKEGGRNCIRIWKKA